LFVAEFIGDTNILRAEVNHLQDDMMKIKIGESFSDAPHTNSFSLGDQIYVSIRPENIHYTNELIPEEQHIDVSVKEIIYSGSVTKLVTELPDKQNIVIQSTNGANIEVGDQLYIHWSAKDVTCHSVSREVVSI